MNRLRIIFISFLIIFIIVAIVSTINLLRPKQESSQNNISLGSTPNLDLAQELQKANDQIQAELQSDALKNSSATALNFSSISNADLRRFSTKTFTNGDQLLELDEAYFFNDRFYSLIEKPLLVSNKLSLPQNIAYFILDKNEKLTFIDFGLATVEELKLQNQSYFLFIQVDLSGVYKISLFNNDLTQGQRFNDSPDKLFSEATKIRDTTILLKLADGNGISSQIESYPVDFTSFILENFPTISQDVPATGGIKFNN